MNLFKMSLVSIFIVVIFSSWGLCLEGEWSTLPIQLPAMGGYDWDYDPVTQNLFCFGGYINGYIHTPINDFYAIHFPEGTVLDLTTLYTPPPRHKMKVSIDPIHRILVVFGGAPGHVADTYIYSIDEGTWYDISGISEPSPRTALCMEWNPFDAKFYLFSGHDGSYKNDLWKLDPQNLNSGWQQITTVNPPQPGRDGGAMAIDPHTGNILVFGGYYHPQGFLGDTWVYNLAGNEWQKIQTDVSPPAVTEAELTYDESVDLFILCFGNNWIPLPQETWAFDVETMQWIEIDLFSQVSGRWDHDFTYIPDIDGSVTYGGFDETQLLGDFCLFEWICDPTPTPTTIPPNYPPVIMAGGYMDTYLKSSQSGELELVVWATDENGLEDIEGVYMYYYGLPTGIRLWDDGTNGDFRADDSFYTFTAEIPRGMPENSSYLFEVMAFDQAGEFSGTWPYLNIHSSVSGLNYQVFGFEKEMLDIIYRKAPDCSNPFILMAGYADSYITYEEGGSLKIIAALVPFWEDGSEIDRVELYYGIIPSGVLLYDDGEHGDFGAGDNIYGTILDFAPGAPPGLYLLNLLAFNEAGHASDPWPYVIIH